MEIIRDSRLKENNKYKTLICPHCNSVLEIEHGDLYGENYDDLYVICGACNKKIYIEDIDIPVTINNVRFPMNFYKFNDKGLCSDNEIDEIIKHCLKEISKDNSDKYNSFYFSIGKIFVSIFEEKEDNCYNIIVAKDFYEATVDKV